MRCLCIILVHLFTLSGCTDSSPGQERSSDQEEEIKEVLTDMWDAIEQGDIERYASHVHPDFTQFGETDPTLNVGKEVEVSEILEWMKTTSDVHTEMEEPRITIKGKVAWIVYYWNDRGISNGEPFASRGKSTRIFVKENGRWLCIHGHYTLLV
jgi:ketosteroid isomerase-like protein